MKLVYIAGPISKGDLVHNINQGTEAFLALLKAGIAGICPMWSAFSGRAFRDPAYGSQVLSVASVTPNDLTWDQWLAYDFQIIARCDAVLRLPGASTGADLETGQAETLGIPVFHSVEDVVRWAYGKK